MPAPAIPFSTEASSPTADWRQEGWSSPNGWKIQLFRLAYRYRAVPWLLFWASAAGAVAMAAYPWTGSRPGGWWAGFASLLGLWLITSAFIVTVSGWFGAGFRYVAWGAAILCGTVVRGLRALWRGLPLVAFFLLLIQVDFKQLNFESGWNLLAVVLAVLGGIILLALVWTGFQVRNRILLQEIKDQTGCEALAACAKGLSERLRGELAGLAQLYDWINRAEGSRSKKNVYSPSIDVQDAGGLLESAVSAEATLDLKFFKVPLGSVLAVASRLLQGARLSGSLHKYDDKLLLVAQMTGAGKGAGLTWQVTTADLDEEDRAPSLPRVLDRMIEQLACRIAADLVSVGSRKWRAVHYFTQALRAYRESQGTENGKQIRLRNAELAFLKALGEDARFAQCHYNLGIVYRDMGNGEAADAAFRRALREDAEPSGACYALAEGYFQEAAERSREDKFDDALWFSGNAIRILPDSSKAWHLYAMSLYYGWVKPEIETGGPHLQENWEKSLEAEALAVGIAWRDFCRWRLKGRLPDRAEASLSADDYRQTAAAFTCSLANGFLLRDAVRRRGKEAMAGPEAGEGRKRSRGRRTPGRRRAWKLIRQAARLAPTDAENYFSWADVLWKTGDLPAAARMLDHVFAGRLERDDRTDFWSLLLATHVALMSLQPREEEHRSIARDACDYLLDVLAARDPGTVEDLAQPLEETVGRLEKALAWAAADGDGLAATQTQGFDQFLEDLAWRPGETPASYLWRLRKLVQFLDELKKVLEVHPAPEHRWRTEPWQALQRLRETRDAYLQERLKALDQAGLPGRLRDLVAEQQKDWEWACSQIAVRLGVEHLKEEHLQAASAHHCLEEALESIKKRMRCHQIVDQRLQSLLAEACLLEARVAREEGNLTRWTDLLRQGVTQAESAVALEPAGYEEHKILGKLYFELGDYERAEEEWKVCRVIKSDPDVLNLHAEAVWRQGLERTDPQARQQAFLQAVKRFEESRELVEKNPGSSAEAHGQVHFWLGVFYRELLQFDQAIFNHKIAWSLGVRPLEARTSLGWAYLEAKMYGEAEATFLAVWKDARRQLAERKKSVDPCRAADPGQEMPLDEIALRILLGRALHDAELGICLRRAENLIREALRHIRGVRPFKRAELLARCRECLGLIRLQRYDAEKGSRTDLETALHHLRRALQLHARCDTYLLLARAHLRRAKAVTASQRTGELESARQDCERARQADLRGRRGKEIEDLLRRVQEEGNAAPAAASEPRPLERSRPAEAA